MPVPVAQSLAGGLTAHSHTTWPPWAGRPPSVHVSSVSGPQERGNVTWLGFACVFFSHPRWFLLRPLLPSVLSPSVLSPNTGPLQLQYQTQKNVLGRGLESAKIAICRKCQVRPQQPAGPDRNNSQSWLREYCRGSQRNGPVSSWCLDSDWKTFSSCLKSPRICQDTKINDPAAVGKNWVVDGKAVRGTLTLGAFWSDKLGYLLVHHDFSVSTAIIRELYWSLYSPDDWEAQRVRDGKAERALAEVQLDLQAPEPKLCFLFTVRPSLQWKNPGLSLMACQEVPSSLFQDCTLDPEALGRQPP